MVLESPFTEKRSALTNYEQARAVNTALSKANSYWARNRVFGANENLLGRSASALAIALDGADLIYATVVVPEDPKGTVIVWAYSSDALFVAEASSETCTVQVVPRSALKRIDLISTPNYFPTTNWSDSEEDVRLKLHYPGMTVYLPAEDRNSSEIAREGVAALYASLLKDLLGG